VPSRTTRDDDHAATAPPERRTGAGASDGLDERLASDMRLVLATAAPLIFAIDPTETFTAWRPLAVSVLLGWFVYSAAVFVLVRRGARSIPATLSPWIDLGWTTLLITFSNGTSSIFFPLYLFSILCASFGSGFRAGFAIVLGSVASFSIVGGLTAPTGPSFELDRSLIRPLYLLVLGYLISFLGAHEVRTRSRLSLLRDVVVLANPRFGADHVLGRLLARLASFYGADGCRLVIDDGHECWMRSARLGAASGKRVVVPDGLAAVLLPEPGTARLLCRAPPGALRWPAGSGAEVLDAEAGGATRAEVSDRLRAALDAASFASVPFPYAGAERGRLYVTSSRRNAFDRSDVEFLVELVEQVVPVLEKIRVVDRLSAQAADEERRRIARDLHDSVIQPYVGFGLGLSAVERALAAGRTEEARHLVARLGEVANQEVQGLRSYVQALKTGEPLTDGVLTGAVRRFCSRFSSVTGIAVDVVAEGEPAVGQRVAGEVFQIVAEALSNVRRHTDAAHASVRIAAREDQVSVQVENEARPGAGEAFSPRSLVERAEALGGHVAVVSGAAGRTTVRVEIPL
jgi:signal transduction histidine kinase